MAPNKSWIHRLSTESGLRTVLESSYDVKLLCLQRFVRLFAYGSTFLILVHFLSNLDIPKSKIGIFMTLTLLGDVVISLFLTLVTDKLGRRNVLAAGSALMVMSGVIFSMTSNYWLLVFSSVIGVISPSGNEIGPFRAIEEAILSHLIDQNKRSDIFAWYTLFGTLGAALGTLLCGLAVEYFQSLPSWTQTDAYRVIFGAYAGFGSIKLILTLMLSTGVEIQPLPQTPHEDSLELEDEALLAEDSANEEEASPGLKKSTTRPQSRRPPSTPTLFERVWSLMPHISPQSISVLLRLMFLFFMDSFASGLASPSWLTYFFTTVHSLPPAFLGTLFMVTNILATVSNLLALPLARRLGPLKTMVFTHLPSALFLALIPLPPPNRLGTWFSMALLSLRACTQSMDQAPRQAFLAAMLLPAERTAVLGMVNVVMTIAQAGGLGCTSLLSAGKLWIVMFGGAGMLKGAYDLLMLWMFLGVKGRDERENGSGNG